MKAQSLIHEYSCGVKYFYLDKSLSLPATARQVEFLRTKIMLIDISAFLRFFETIFGGLWGEGVEGFFLLNLEGKWS